SNPTDVFAQYDVIRTCYALGIAFRDRGRWGDAIRFLESGAEIGIRLAAMDPDATLWNQDRFRIHHELSRLQLENGDLASARVNCQIAEALLDSPCSAWDSEAERNVNRAWVAILGGRLYLHEKQSQRALGRFGCAS